MSKELETMTYMMAAEKMGNLIFTMENTIEFLLEYQVKHDEEVKNALSPLIKQMNEWIKNE